MTKPILFSGRALGRAVDGSRKITFRASTPALDRHGTIIKPEGINTEKYDRNSVFLWAHDGYGTMFGGGPSVDHVIGRVVAHRKSPQAFDIDVEFAPADVNPTAEQAFRLVDAGFLNAVSIGFMPLKVHEEEMQGRGMIQVYDEVELLEISLVPIPSNPEALSLLRAIIIGGLPEEQRLARHMFGTQPSDTQLGAADVLLRIGKVLSSVNEQRIRNAVDALSEVLATLKAPEPEQPEEPTEPTEPRDTPTPPASAADTGAVTAAVTAAFECVLRPKRMQAAITTALRKALP